MRKACARVPEPARDAARGTKSGAAIHQRRRWANDTTPGLPHQPEEEETHRRVLWLAEDDCSIPQGAASGNVEGRLDVQLCVRRLQPGAHAKSDGRRSSSAVSPGHSVSA